MHRKYAKDGFAAVSVSVDENPRKPEVREKALKFLQSQKATFTNLLLDESPEVWQKKLGIDGVPAVFVFDRRQAKPKKFADNVDYANIEKQVVEFLKEK